MRYFLIALLTLSFLNAEDLPKLPANAQAVVFQMETTINKARQEAIIKLDKMIGDVTKTGNLELAMAIKAKQKEIGDAMPKIDLFGDQNPVVGKWKTDGGNMRDYKEHGSLEGVGGKQGKWSITGNKLIVVWNDGIMETFTLPIKNNTLSGYNNKGTSFIMTKVVAK